MSMSENPNEPLRKVLIASANPLFALGLQKMVADRWERRGAQIRIANSMDEAVSVLESWVPDLVIVDYDDVGRPGSIQRPAFLSHFISGERPMQVMLVSLSESGEVVVYDRRSLTPAQAEDWLDLPWPAAPEFPVVSKERPRSGGMKHFVIVGVITAVVTVLTFIALNAVGLLPVQASAQAGPIDRMINMQLWMIAFLFSLITVAIVYSVVVFRSKPGDDSPGPNIKGSTRLEVMWTLFPLITVIYLSFLGAQALGEVRSVDPQALQVKVTGFQWSWLFEYPEYGIQSNTLYLPVDQQAQLLLTSRDVIHSFWVPEFRVKQDALPGENLVKELRLTPTIIGDYTVMCAELCGGAHAYMNSPVKVVSQEDFDAWLAEQTSAADADPAERGERVSRANGCIGCHSLDGAALPGPTWQGLFGAEVTLADGSTTTVDEEYLHTAIVDPNVEIHEGFPPNLMPATYGDMLTEEQIQDIIEFIKTVQ